jgi:hypothetical protein
MINYSEMEPTANIVRDEEQAVYHRMPWWRRNICILTKMDFHTSENYNTIHSTKPVDIELYSLKVHFWLKGKDLKNLIT